MTFWDILNKLFNEFILGALNVVLPTENYLNNFL